MRLLLLACLLAGAGCSAEAPVLYLPDIPKVVAIAGYPAARYDVPPQAPHGSARVASFGVTWVDPPGFATVRAMHVRLLIENRDDEGPWDLDVRKLRAVFGASGAFPAALVNATTSSLPVLRIPPGREAAVDAYFLVPGALARQEVPAFEVEWTLDTPEGAVAGRTRFERRVLEGGAGQTVRFGYGLGLAPYWWLTPRLAPRDVGARPPRVYLGYPSPR